MNQGMSIKMTSHYLPLKSGGTFPVDSNLVPLLKDLGPFDLDVKGEVTCKRGKLINALATDTVRYRQVAPGQNFTHHNVQWVSTVPQPVQNGVYYRVPLSGKKGWGKSTLIDAQMLPVVHNKKWHFHDGYAKNGKKLLHRVVMSTIKGINAIENLVVDHINGDRLDNRIENLRILTSKGNAKNRTSDPVHNNLVGVMQLGVSRYATVHKKLQIFVHATPDLCALCYDSVMFYTYGKGCRMNDNKSAQPLDISYWNLSPEIMTKLNAWREKHTDYEGVSHVNGKWKATLKLDLGTFDNKHDAARARDAAVIMFGQKGHLNFNESEQLKVVRQMLERLYT